VSWLNWGFLIIGCGALVWMLREIGWAELRDMLGSIGWWTAPILGVSLVGVLLEARANHIFMRPEQRMVSYWRVFAAQLSGWAINSVTPTGKLGEFAKATLLIGHAPRYRAVSAVVLINLVNVFASAAFLLLALAVSFAHPGIPERLLVALYVVFGLLLIGTVASIVMVRRGLIRSLAGAARKLRVISDARRERLATRLEAFDDQVRPLGRRSNVTYGSGIAYVVAARVLGWIDLWIILLALDANHSLAFVVIAAALGMIVGTLAAIVPMGVGTAEGGQAGLFQVLGAGAALGLAVGLVRRLRTLVIAALGFLVMISVQAIDQWQYSRGKARIIERAGDPQ
jgi:uncharacterized protein (TIRG00374 family)